MKTIILQDGKEVQVTSEKKTVHNIFLLDASGSMTLSGSTFKGTEEFQSKYDAAIQSINQEIEELRSTEDVNVKMSIYEFDSNRINTERITEHCFAQDICEVGTIEGRGASGNTPLYQSIAYVIEKFLNNTKRGEKVLLKIFTDGEHNCYWGKYGTEKACKELIAKAEKDRGFLVTFIGTEKDTRFVVDNLGIKVSNTMSYNGTAMDLKAKMKRSTTSTATYFANVAEGADTLENFYSNTTTDNKS